MFVKYYPLGTEFFCSHGQKKKVKNAKSTKQLTCITQLVPVNRQKCSTTNVCSTFPIVHCLLRNFIL